MKRFLLGTVVLAALTAGGPALAADMPLKAPRSAPTAVAYSWDGFYIGGHVGYGWGDADVTLVPGPGWTTLGNAAGAAYLVANGSPTLNPDGVLGGVQAGYNLQRGQFVFGVEADFSFADINGGRSTGVIEPPPGAAIGPRAFAESDRLRWLATGRGRVGYAMENVLLYATGGVAAGRREFSQFLTTPSAENQNFGSREQTKTGWTAGGGLEYAFARNWTAKAEYLYVDLGSVSVFSDSNTAPGFGLTINSSSDFTLHIVRAGLNYKFDGGGPVVARY